MNKPTKFDEIRDKLEAELDDWQTRIDEARVQLKLGGMEAEEKLQPYIEQLEKELDEAKGKWAELEQASEKSWADIKLGLDISMDSMKEAFSNAKKHFTGNKAR